MTTDKTDDVQEQLESLAVSPINVLLKRLPHLTDYLSHSDIILRQIVYDFSGNFPSSSPHFAYHRAGPRKDIFFRPDNVRAAIVTCGGLCPGLNTVIRELVVGLSDHYGVRNIFGIKAGYRGFYSSDPLPFDPKLVHNWHKKVGTVLATSRGGFDLQKIVNAIEAHDYNQDFIKI